VPLYYPSYRFFIPRFWKRYKWERRLYDRAFHASLALHLTHKGCMDGALSDFLVRRAYGPGAVDSLFIDPTETAEVLRKLSEVPGRARDLVVSDLSFQKGQDAEIAESLRALEEGGWRIQWRDHHHKQWEGANLDALEAHARLTVDFASAECGASLVQKALLPNDEQAKALAEVVRDHDLWLRKDPRSAMLADAFYEMGGYKFQKALEENPSPENPVFLEAAKKARARKEKLLELGLRKAKLHREGGATVAILYGYFPTNELLHGLYDRQGADIGILIKPTGSMSLRSRKGMECCHLVAQQFGGGGHPNASGGKLNVSGLGFPSYWMRRESHPEAQRLVQTALQVASAHLRAAPEKKA